MNDRTGALWSRQGAEASWPGARNTRYVSSRTPPDADRSSPRFIPHASIESWRDSMCRDDRMRAALLNPIRHEPRGR
ncbi:MAG: hypothetical protein JWP76_4279 [Dactylosporangium sp.]|jgi:hypothetical protein|nr:hypothetical protein [Dactylosporangium sp.]